MQIYLYQLRKEKGITQKELAQKLGISETAYRQKEKGQRAFKSDEMFIIADILEKDIGDIFSDPRPRNVVIWEFNINRERSKHEQRSAKSNTD